MKKVVYLFGAGASQGSVSATGSSVGLLMRDLTEDINDALHVLVQDRYSTDISVQRFVNEVIDKDIDIEQVVTFLEESTSRTHRELAGEFRTIFRDVPYEAPSHRARCRLRSAFARTVRDSI